MEMLDEHMTLASAMQFSVFKKPFEERIEKWNNKLLSVSDTIEERTKIQRQWIYLQPIFDSADITKQLPAESRRFKAVDKI